MILPATFIFHTQIARTMATHVKWCHKTGQAAIPVIQVFISLFFLKMKSKQLKLKWLPNGQL